MKGSRVPNYSKFPKRYHTRIPKAIRAKSDSPTHAISTLRTPVLKDTPFVPESLST